MKSDLMNISKATQNSLNRWRKCFSRNKTFQESTVNTKCNLDMGNAQRLRSKF